MLEVTLVTDGTTPSTKIALFAPREPAAPGDAKVRDAAFPTASVIAPPLRASDVVAP